ncbi:MAG: thermonuclease family protein [Pseudomonadales bacterium]
MAGSRTARLSSMKIALALGMTIVLLTALTAPASGSSPNDPQLEVIDGDTLDLNGRTLQLAGIDAPELGQWCLDGDHLYACGMASALELHKLLTLETVTCSPAAQGDGTYDCLTPRGPLAELLVEQGLAVSRSGGVLKTAETAARRVPLGIWRGAFIDPADWRDGTRLDAERAAPEPCPVLGTLIGAVRAYLVPTDADYAALEAQPGAVLERWCSDEQARAAGYLHAAGPFLPRQVGT